MCSCKPVQGREKNNGPKALNYIMQMNGYYYPAYIYHKEVSHCHALTLEVGYDGI